MPPFVHLSFFPVPNDTNADFYYCYIILILLMFFIFPQYKAFIPTWGKCWLKFESTPLLFCPMLFNIKEINKVGKKKNCISTAVGFSPSLFSVRSIHVLLFYTYVHTHAFRPSCLSFQRNFRWLSSIVSSCKTYRHIQLYKCIKKKKHALHTTHSNISFSFLTIQLLGQCLWYVFVTMHVAQLWIYIGFSSNIVLCIKTKLFYGEKKDVS